jgi:hypothetical protein
MEALEIDSVIWRQLGNLIEVIYADWHSVQSRGDQAMAAKIAEDAGLHTVSAPDGMAKWIRDPGSVRTIPSGAGRWFA